MERRESPIIPFMKILGQLETGGHIDEAFVEHVQVVGEKMRKVAKMTIMVTSTVCASILYQTLFQLITSGGRFADTALLNGPSLIPFQVFAVALAVAFLYVGLVDYQFASHLSRLIQEARVKEKSLPKKMTAQELI